MIGSWRVKVLSGVSVLAIAGMSAAVSGAEQNKTQQTAVQGETLTEMTSTGAAEEIQLSNKPGVFPGKAVRQRVLLRKAARQRVLLRKAVRQRVPRKTVQQKVLSRRIKKIRKKPGGRNWLL